MKVSKVVLIVVALHVLVIGGIFVFEGCSRSKTSTPDMAENESLPGDQTAGLTPAIPTPQGPGAATTAAPGAVAGNEALTPPAPSTAPAAASTYVVKKGDSLWKIAKTEGVSVGDLSRANSLTKTSTLKIGQKLTVPAAAEKTTVALSSVAPTPTTAEAIPAPAAIETGGAAYTVKSGDSLWKIARQQNVSVAALKQANNLSGDSLKIGQKLQLPAAAQAAAIAPTSSTAWREPGTYTENGQTIHIVDFNDTPGSIANKYGITTEALMKGNNLTNARAIQYGQRLVIPSTQQTAAAPATPVVSTATPAVAGPVVSASSMAGQ